jgi:3-methyladenine DNA glycosylase AlkD
VDVLAAVERLERELRDAGSPERAEQERRYLRSDLVHVGASVPRIRTAARGLARDVGPPRHADLLALVEALWTREIHELRMAAVELCEVWQAVLVPHDVDLLERLVREARTWALVDGLAVDVIAPLLDRHPRRVDVLDRWAADGDMWVRRAALLSHLPSIRAGETDAFARFGGYADLMLDDREFFVRKAIGWVLREAGKRDPAAVAAWLGPRIGRAAGVTVREAVKHLPPDDREALLDAYRRR